MLDRLLDPASIAIVGLSEDTSKHGGRVLAYLRRLDYRGSVVGVNPRLPTIDGVEVFAKVADLPEPPDLMVCAVPAAAVASVVRQSERAGFAVVFAGGFGETGEEGRRLEDELVDAASVSGVGILGPNSGGVIRPGSGLAASFLTCLDRPATQIRSGRVGLVTQSGGTGSYLHNLAAARGSGLAISVSTGNELQLKLGEVVGAVSELDEVAVVLAVIETVRDGTAFIDSVRAAIAGGKPVVVCRIGTGRQGKQLMTTHTGAMAVPERVLEGILASLGAIVAETPGEAYEVAEILAATTGAVGDRVGIVTHSGGIAIHLADLAERQALNLPAPNNSLRSTLEPLLDLGAANNPLDMGGIIGGPTRFGEIVNTFANSGEYDSVLAVSTAHPPHHSEDRARALVAIDSPVPILHLWMAGDQATRGLELLRSSSAPVTEEPRAAIRALAGLAPHQAPPDLDRAEPIRGGIETWGLPLVEGRLVADAKQAIKTARELGYPVAVKVSSPGLAHKTDVGGVRLNLRDADAVADAFDDVTNSARAGGLAINGARVERFRPGLEMIIGALVDPIFGPLVSVGIGGVLTELLHDVTFAPAPVTVENAGAMIDRLRGRALLDGFRGSTPVDLNELSVIMSLVSRGLVGSGAREVEINPLIWDGTGWVAVDWWVVPSVSRPSSLENVAETPHEVQDA